MLNVDLSRIVNVFIGLSSVETMIIMEPITNGVGDMGSNFSKQKPSYFGLNNKNIQDFNIAMKANEEARNALSTSIATRYEKILLILEHECVELGLPFSANAIKRIKNDHIVKKTITVADIQDIVSRITDEFNTQTFLQIAPNKASYFTSENCLWGDKVADSFPSIVKEINEAGKCYALGRCTASAFHTLRCLEAGLKAVSRSLNIDDPTKGADKNWSVILNKIKQAIDAKWPSPKDKLSEDYKAYEELYACFMAIKNPYRNQTMHLEKEYSEDQAKHIFELVGGTMKLIANHMDEHGVYKN